MRNFINTNSLTFVGQNKFSRKIIRISKTSSKKVGMYKMLLKGYFTNTGTKITYYLFYSLLWKTKEENRQNLRCNMLKECTL